MPITRQAQRIFQSTPPRGWRPYNHGLSLSQKNFNPLHHEGGDGSCSTSPVHLTHFNPLHHEGGDYFAKLEFRRRIVFQSTPPRGWRHWVGPGHVHGVAISIHSTTRVETVNQSVKCYFIKISIHSTTRVETQQISSPFRSIAISIHSTTRVETINQINPPSFLLFQSTPPRGWRRSLTDSSGNGS